MHIFADFLQLTTVGKKINFNLKTEKMKKILFLVLLANTALFGQTQEILTEDFNNSPSLSNWIYVGEDANASRVIDDNLYNIANKGPFLRLGIKGNQDSSAFKTNAGAEPSDSVTSTFLFGYKGNFADPSMISYNPATKKVRVSDARVEKNWGFPIYSPVLGDTLMNFMSTFYIDLNNVSSFVQDQFYTGTYALSTTEKGISANSDVSILSYQSAITVLAYNRDSSVTVLASPENFKNSVCGNDPGFGDINLWMAWNNCMTAAGNLVDPSSFKAVVPVFNNMGIDDVSTTRYYTAGCSNPDALNFDGLFRVDDGTCVLPQDLVDSENAIVTVQDGIDTTINQIVERIRVNVVRECNFNLNSTIDEVVITNTQLFSSNDSILIDWRIQAGQLSVNKQTRHAITNTGVTKALITLYCNIPQGADQVENVITQGDYIAATYGFVFDSEGVITSVNQIERYNNTYVYPNPVTENGALNISSRVDWTLFSVEGKFVRSGLGNQIDISGLQPGTYTVRLNNENQVVVIK